MKKTLLAGLAAGLLMAGTALATPDPATYSQTFFGNATDSNYASLSASGSGSVTLDFDLTSAGYAPGAYNPISAAYLKFFFSDIDAGVSDTVRVSAGLYDGNTLITEQTFNLGVFVPATYKTEKVTQTANPGSGYISNGICIANCNDTVLDTSDDIYRWTQTLTATQHSSPGSGYEQGACAANCTRSDSYSGKTWVWTKTTTTNAHSQPSGTGWVQGSCRSNCTNTKLNTANDQFVWSREVVDVAAHNDRSVGELIIDLGTSGLLGYLQDGTFTSIVLTPTFGTYTNDIRLDEAFLSATTSPVDPPPPVPEPGTMMLLGMGMFGMAVYGKRRASKA